MWLRFGSLLNVAFLVLPAQSDVLLLSFSQRIASSVFVLLHPADSTLEFLGDLYDMVLWVGVTPWPAHGDVVAFVLRAVTTPQAAPGVNPCYLCCFFESPAVSGCSCVGRTELALVRAS